MTARCKPKKDSETGKYLHNNQAAKSGLNKAILDAAWGELKLKTKAVAKKSGKLVLEVDPKHSSQECSHCGYISPTHRDREKFLCENCGHHDDADVQASINILNRGLKVLGISPSQLCGVPAKVTLEPELTGSSKKRLGDGSDTSAYPTKQDGTEKSLSVGTDEPENPRTGEWVQLRLGDAEVSSAYPTK